MSEINRPITKPQIKELLLADGKQAMRIRRGLIGLLVEHTQVPNLAELPTAELVGKVLAVETPSNPLGYIIQTIIAPTSMKEPESHNAARRIMGGNFLGVAEVAETFGLASPEARATLVNIPFSEATLRFCHGTHVLVADIGLSIIDVFGRVKRRPSPSCFDRRGKDEEFAKRTERVAWRLIRKTSVAQSRYNTWSQQTALLGKDEEVPTARRVEYAVMLRYATTCERLLDCDCVRTIDVTSRGRRVCVESFDEVGRVFDDWSDDAPHIHFGVASSRK